MGAVPVVSVRRLQRLCEQRGHMQNERVLVEQDTMPGGQSRWTQRFVCVLCQLRQLRQRPCQWVLDAESGCHSCRGNGKSLLCGGLPGAGVLCKWVALSRH